MLLEHDYIGLSETVPSMERESSGAKTSKNGLNLKATELRLGLPGSEYPKRDDVVGVGATKLKISLLSAGAKRVFSDAIDGASGNWVFSPGSDPDLGHNLFSPKPVNGGSGAGAGGGTGKPLAGSEQCKNQSVKDGVSVPQVQSPKPLHDKINNKPQPSPPASKAQVVGWPPIRSFRKNSMAPHPPKAEDDAEGTAGSGCLYVKVSMDGAPYLRKVDLKTYGSYMELSSALEKKFSCFTIGQCSSNAVSSRDGLSKSRLMDLLHGSEYVLTYEDKDGDWMLVGDVPWEMFTESCKRLRIMKSSDAIGLAPRAMEKCKNRT